MTNTYYHVASAAYEEGDDLLSWHRLVARGDEPEWKWPDAPVGFDGDAICLFRDRADAEDFLTAHGGRLLRIDVPDDAEPEYRRVDEGYIAIRWMIPAAWITVV